MKLEKQMNYKVKLFTKKDVKICELRLTGDIILEKEWNFHVVNLMINKTIIENKEDLK